MPQKHRLYVSFRPLMPQHSLLGTLCQGATGGRLRQGGILLDEESSHGVMNGEAGRILKCIFTSRDNAEACVRRIPLGYEAIILTDYDDGDEPYVQLLEEQHCYDLYEDETKEEEEEDDD